MTIKFDKQIHYTCVLFGIVVVGTGLGGLTQTALNSMAAVVLADLGTDIGWGQWLTTLYIFAMGAAVPLASYVQRRLSVRTLILGAYTFYLVGSVCDFCAVNFGMLIIGRILEALSTGVLMPLLQTIAMTRFPENRHGTAMGVAGISLGFAPNVGPIIGGAIATAASWRFLFLVLSVASVVLILATLLVCNERQPKDPAAVLDPVSLLLSTCGFGGLLFGLTAAANMSVTSPIVWATILLGAVCVVAFVRRQKLSAHPLIRLGIFGTRQFRVSLLAQCALYGCFMGMTLIIPLEVIEGGGHTALEAGAVLFPGAVAAFVCEPMAGMASDRFGARRVSIFGGIFLLAGAASIVALPVDAPLWAFALTQTLRCVGLTTLIPTTTAYALAPLHAAGLTTDGSATLIMCRQIFAAMATALMVMGIKTFNVCPGDTLGYTVALAISAALAVVCLTTVVATIKDK